MQSQDAGRIYLAYEKQTYDKIGVGVQPGDYGTVRNNVHSFASSQRGDGGSFKPDRHRQGLYRNAVPLRSDGGQNLRIRLLLLRTVRV